jgi:hypothetical protein
MLTPEFESGKPPGSELSPELPFLVSLRLSQVARLSRAMHETKNLLLR